MICTLNASRLPWSPDSGSRLSYKKPGGNPNKSPALLVFGLPTHNIFLPRVGLSHLAARGSNKAIAFEWRFVLHCCIPFWRSIRTRADGI